MKINIGDLWIWQDVGGGRAPWLALVKKVNERSFFVEWLSRDDELVGIEEEYRFSFVECWCREGRCRFVPAVG